jgi:hypothetical protein
VSSTTHRSFTLRVPIDFYLELGAKAQAEDVPLNQLANRLLRLGMDKHVSLDDALRSLLMDRIIQADPAVLVVNA